MARAAVQAFDTGTDHEGYDASEVIDIGNLKVQLSERVLNELGAAFIRKKDAADSYKDAAEAVAEKAGIEASVLKAYVKARVDGKLVETRAKAAQLALLFDEL